MKPIKLLIKKANVAANRQRANFAKRLGITGVQMSVIDFIANEGNTTSQHLIEQELGIRRSTTTVLVQGMEKRGLIKRIDDPKDKRKKLVQLTPQAQDLVLQIKDFIKEDDQELLSHFTEPEIKAVRKVLNYIGEEGKND